MKVFQASIVLVAAFSLLITPTVNGHVTRVKRQDEDSAAVSEDPTANLAEAVDEAVGPASEDSTDENSFGGIARVESTTDPEWINRAIQKHNEYRALHGSSPLAESKTLNNIAQAYADELAQNLGPMQHNPNLQKALLGENLYYSSFSVEEELEPETPVNAWYDEIKDYNFDTGFSYDENKEILHFTQLVWKNTKEVGIAKTVGVKEDGTHITYVVANYNPRGNFDDFKENVLPIQEGGYEIVEASTGSIKIASTTVLAACAAIAAFAVTRNSASI